MLMEKILRQTYSVCPVCLERIPAVHVARGREVHLVKQCPKHGDFSAVIWRGLRDLEEWRGDQPPIREGENEQCPHACGLCPDHSRTPAAPFWK
jgi:uncharacterized radical SAM superfamily Fe-S cluster-containing enzyme